MASVSTQKKTGLRRVIFFDLSGRRSAIHVGKISMTSAREIAGHVQHLVICRKSGTDCRRSTTDWVERIRQDWPNLANRLGEFGLIAIKVWSDPSFTDFAESLIATRSDVKPNTVKPGDKRQKRFGYPRKICSKNLCSSVMANPAASGGGGVGGWAKFWPSRSWACDDSCKIESRPLGSDSRFIVSPVPKTLATQHQTSNSLGLGFRDWSSLCRNIVCHYSSPSRR